MCSDWLILEHYSPVIPTGRAELGHFLLLFCREQLRNCAVYKDLQCTYQAIFVFIHIKPFIWGCSCHLCRHGSLKLPDDDVTIAGWSDVSHLVSCHHLFNSQLSYSLLPMSSHQLVSSRMSVCKHLLVLLSLITKLSINKVLTVICCNIFVLIVHI